jgi:hypothetical protein
MWANNGGQQSQHRTKKEITQRPAEGKIGEIRKRNRANRGIQEYHYKDT